MRLTKRQKVVLDDIVEQVGSRAAALAILQSAAFLHWSREHIEAELNRRRLAAGGPAELPSTLRDMRRRSGPWSHVDRCFPRGSHRPGSAGRQSQWVFLTFSDKFVVVALPQSSN